MESTHPIIYTIGHGRHAWTDFLALLQQAEVAFVADVRSAARSRWPQFNGVALARVLREAGLGYEHLPECGGKVRVHPDELARGIDRIMELAAEMRVVLMCSESQPLTAHKRRPQANCHRVGLLAPLLRARGARLIHLLPNGKSVEFDEAAVDSLWADWSGQALS